jgi:uncharacterized caspase-like protein
MKQLKYYLIVVFTMLSLFATNIGNAVICEPPFCDKTKEKRFGESGERFALVIGNSNYPGQAQLANPQNDAADISVKLEEMGFKVETLTNTNFASMKAAIDRFGSKLIPGAKSVGLFFFAGHGMQQSDQNFLIPVDTVEKIESSGQVDGNAVSLNHVVEAMNNAGVSIIVLDACRNNQMAESISGSGRTLKRAEASASFGQTSTTRQVMGSGLAQPPKAKNRALFAYATSPGDTAADGTGHHSPFTTGLLTSIRKEHRLEEVFAEAAELVRTTTSKKQTPWLTHSLGDVRFYF